MELIEILNNVWPYIVLGCFVLTTIKFLKIVKVKYKKMKYKYRKIKRFIKSKEVRISLSLLKILLGTY